ncbi:MAG: hypothetical protein GX491_13800 [Chloroflexi bacterium]|nr:hypothetical protein [Chloroflexota bacterium]
MKTFPLLLVCLITAVLLSSCAVAQPYGMAAYQFTVANAVTLKAGVDFGIPAPSPHIRLKSPDGQVFPPAAEVTVPEDGAYDLKVDNDPASDYNAYSLVILSDSSVEQEPNDSPAAAQPLLPGQSMIGFTGIIPDITEPASLPYEFANSRYTFGMVFDENGKLRGAGYLPEGSSESVRFFDIGDPHRFILHDGQSDIGVNAMGFHTIESKWISETRRFSSFTG